MTNKKSIKSKKDVVEFPFYYYLVHFYQSNRGLVRNHYKVITKKFLDFNDPDNPNAFLRKPQFEALEMYIFLKEYLSNRHLHDIFEEWYKKRGLFEKREGADVKGNVLLFDDDASVFEEAFKNLKEFSLDYPNYIFALTMGIGKTVLMATSIFYEFLLANKFPKDQRYCHNALVFAPDKTVLQSLKEIQTFDKSKVVPPEYLHWLDTHLQFHYLDDTGISLNTVDRSMFNIIISNTQKIILKKQHAEHTPAQIFFDGMDARYRAKSIIDEMSDLYDFDSEIDLIPNQRFSKLIRLEQLGIYVDEAHHVFGNKLEKDMRGTTGTSLRLTINELAKNLEEKGTHVVACYNYTGTPYTKNKLLPEVVYAYGLKDAINNEYLKEVKVKGYSNIKSNEFIKSSIKEFWDTHNDKRYEGMLPKIALFASTIDELDTELRPAVEKVLTKLDIPLTKILVNVGDDKLTSNDDLREFINLDTPQSEKQFILLVNKGKEGWNCRSLFAVCLFRQPKSRIFVLQATMRCLRSITNVQQSGSVFLSDENLTILESELEENFRMTVDDMNRSGNKESVFIQVKPVHPIPEIPIKKVYHLHQITEKKIEGDIDLKLNEINYENYHIIKTTKDMKDITGKAINKEDISHIKENIEYTPLTLVAEISRYLNKPPLEVEKILDSTTDRIEGMLEKINEYNEILYDWIIPHLFQELYDIKTFRHEEMEAISLVKDPPEGYYTVKSKTDLRANMDDTYYKQFKSKSFHLDNYCFDSNPEKMYYDSQLKVEDNEKIYYTGMLTHGQSDFLIHYIDPDSNSLRSYYPDFLIKNKDGSYSILEVKADFMVDDRVVQAKSKFAQEMAIASGMVYKIVKQSEILGGKEGSVQGRLFFIDDYRGREYKDALPVFSLKAACGKFGDGQVVEPEGWVEVKNKKGMGEGWFVARAEGKSMEPSIMDGDLCIFRPVAAGTKQGKIYLFQYNIITDPDSGGSYSLKRYERSKGRDADGKVEGEIILESINPDFNNIVLTSGDEDIEDQVKPIAEFDSVLSKNE